VPTQAESWAPGSAGLGMIFLEVVEGRVKSENAHLTKKILPQEEGVWRVWPHLSL
jgi:hypothetical protein